MTTIYDLRDRLENEDLLIMEGHKGKQSHDCSYTLGMIKFGLPEIIKVGMDSNFDWHITGNLMLQLKDKFRADPTKVKPQLIEDVILRPLVLIEADADLVEPFAKAAFVYAQITERPAPCFMQILWTDEDGRLPWADGFKPLPFEQLVLCRNPAAQFPA
ncbi:hypothetical protein HNP46_000379 [Pseudomonas nitritireducens]|uniref:DUF4262 domain-containing protein n=1 Tax=Pseudomonas nitroreducens TaxID=46680 RepID=A0A7W7KFY4_PSENT|nr:DUF4262 domain-containing protein [Pseudomonas nitritireducens]MBB4861568.1 hypothetical protein [Pseudomonas nitritireducens]